MPEFHLHMRRVLPSGRVTHHAPHPFYRLDDFARGYVEAMFFTNGDIGDDRENLLNDWGVDRLTREAVADIEKDCRAFQSKIMPDGCLVRQWLDRANEATGYDDAQAGRDFWFTRQGHGTGFGDRFDEIPDDATREGLHTAARGFGEATVEACRGWIYHY